MITPRFVLRLPLSILAAVFSFAVLLRFTITLFAFLLALCGLPLVISSLRIVWHFVRRIRAGGRLPAINRCASPFHQQ
jgi:hypothetical protein